MLGLHSTAHSGVQGGRRGKQGPVGDTLAEMHMGPDAGVSAGEEAAVEGTLLAVHCMLLPVYALADTCTSGN